MPNIFILLIYQPFFNLLVGIYLGLQSLPFVHKDMGVAVIIFTVVFRFLWLPFTLAGDRSEKESREAALAVEKIKAEFSDDPVREKLEFRKLMRRNKRLIFFTSLDLGFQILIALMLYRIFTAGLEGADFHYLYRFMPEIKEKLNLVFLGRFDLTRPNTILNLWQTILIFLAEFFSLAFSPFPVTRKDFTTLFSLPVFAFIFFLFMPAGKKLFIITTLIFSILYMIARKLIFVFHGLIKRESVRAS